MSADRAECIRPDGEDARAWVRLYARRAGHDDAPIDEWVVVALCRVVGHHRHDVKGRLPRGWRWPQAVEIPPRKQLPSGVVRAPRPLARDGARCSTGTIAHVSAIEVVDDRAESDRPRIGQHAA